MFLQMHNIGNNGINANFVLPYICNFFLCEVSKFEIKCQLVLKVCILKL